MRVVLLITSWFVPFTLFSQIVKEGVPLAWSVGNELNINNIWKELPDHNILDLLAEDAIDQANKVLPYRFAIASNVNYTPENSGRWTNLSNGDRVWMLGLESKFAFSLNVIFGKFNLPEGGKVYIYNEDRSDFVGPLTSKNNRAIGNLISLPLEGNKVIVEYYEPYRYRGIGELLINKVAQGYKPLEEPERSETSCITPIEWVNEKIRHARSSTLLMLVDDGQRVCTGGLLNNTQSNGNPLFVTSSNALMGDPSDWVFVFGLNADVCSNNDVTCWDRAIAGAEVLEVDGENGLALLGIFQKPESTWGVYFAGWNVEDPIEGSYFCIQNAFGLSQSYSSAFTDPQVADWGGLQVAEIDVWNIGNTFVGSLGAPLYNSEGDFIGALIGGQSDCTEGGSDYFGLLATSWEKFAPYLNPTRSGRDESVGFFPIFTDKEEVNKEGEQFFIFPNPADDFVYIQNESREEILVVRFTDTAGRILSFSNPQLPTIAISDLPSGIYEMTILTTSSMHSQKIIIR